MTLQQATSKEAYPVRRIVREFGHGIASTWIAVVLSDADMLCGDKCSPQQLAAFGRALLNEYMHLSAESIVLAIKKGMRNTVYGSLTYPQICEWMKAIEEEIVNLAESEHSTTQFKGDNRDGRYLDRLEQQARDKDSKELSGTVKRLREKLRTDNYKKDAKDALIEQLKQQIKDLTDNDGKAS